MSHKTAGNRLVLVGAGAHAKVCLEILKLRREFEIIGILDDEKPVGYEVMGAKVLGDSSLLQQLWRDGVPYAVNAVGSILNPPRRKQIFERLKSAGFLVPNLVHPSAIIEPSVRMGEGNQIMMGACVGSDVALGDNCIINSGAIISHDCSIGDHCHFAPGCVIAGLVQVGELAVIGMAATVFFKTTIGAGATIANGAHVFKDIAAGHFVKNTGT